MADDKNRLLLGLHKTRIPINSQPGILRVTSTSRDDKSAGNRGPSLAEEVRTRRHLGPTLHHHLPRTDLSDDKRTKAVRNLFVEREHTLAKNKEDYLSKRSELHRERNQLLAEQERLKRQSLPPALADDGVPKGFTFWRDPRNQIIQGSRSLAEVTRQHLTSQEGRFHEHRAAHRAAAARRLQPYNGELGPQSYAAWQMDDYFMVRQLVEDMADHVINNVLHLYPPSQGDRETDRARQEAEEEVVSQWQRQLDEGRLVQLVMEELLLQESSKLTALIAKEIVSLWQMIRTRTDMALMKTAESIATGQESGREPEDPAYDLVTKTFFSLEHHRDKYREGVWAHSQQVELLGPTVDTEEQEDSDVLLLEFEHITPMSLRQTESRAHDTYLTRVMKGRWAGYRDAEARFWNNMSTQLSTVNLAKRTTGVVTARVSADQQLLALGTAHGDILLYNLMMSPWQLIGTLHNQDKDAHDPIVDLAFNAMNAHLLSIHYSGVLQLWSLLGLRVRSQNDTKRLDLSPDAYNVYPEQLAQLLLLDGSRSDLNLQRGPLADAGVHNPKIRYLPDLAAFSPTFTLLGTQPCISVALHTGDILRLDLEMTLRENTEMVGDPDQERPMTNQTDRASLNQNNNASGSRPSTQQTALTAGVPEKMPRFLNPPLRGMGSAATNKVGQNIPAELFRHHKCSVLFLGYVDNVGDMVTVDQNGYVFIWSYTESSMTSYGWFHPHNKYRISGSKAMYRAAQNVQPNMVFSSQRKDLTRKQLGKERERVEAQLEELELRDPWHEELVQDNSHITQVYLPKEGVSAESGAMFHVITRHRQSHYLYTYITQLYEPVKVKSTRMLGVQQTPNGDALVFLLLFPEYPPKAPTITIVIMDLHTMTLRDYNCGIDLTDQQYSKCLHEQVVSFDISRPVGPTGASYLFLTYMGIFTAISLTSGQSLLTLENPKTPDPNFVGCRLSSKSLTVPAQARVVVSSPPGRIIAALYYHGEEKKLQTQVQVVELTDGGTASDRRETWKATERWLGPEGHNRRDQRVDRMSQRLPARDHYSAWCLLTVLECMDRAVQRVDGQYEEEEENAHLEADAQYAYTSSYPKRPPEDGVTPAPSPAPTEGARGPSTRGSQRADQRSRPFVRGSGRLSGDPRPGTSGDPQPGTSGDPQPGTSGDPQPGRSADP